MEEFVFIVVGFLLFCAFLDSLAKGEAEKDERKQRAAEEEQKFEAVKAIRVTGRSCLRSGEFMQKFDVSVTFPKEKKVSLFIDSPMAVDERFQYNWKSITFFDASGNEIEIQKDCFTIRPDPKDGCMFLDFN